MHLSASDMHLSVSDVEGAVEGAGRGQDLTIEAGSTVVCEPIDHALELCSRPRSLPSA